jgi:hypothetical protein
MAIDRRKEKIMKTLLMLVFGGAVGYTPIALAEPSFDAGQLGRMRGILDLCARVSPHDAAQYLLQMKALIGDAPKATVDDATKTDEYQQAYQSITAELRNMGPNEMVQACNFYLTTN